MCFVILVGILGAGFLLIVGSLTTSTIIIASIGLLFVLALVFLPINRSTYFDPFPGASPRAPALYFECKKHNWEKLLSFYDRHHPPTCPTCRSILTRSK